MDRVAIPLRLMGAQVEGEGDRLLPPIIVGEGRFVASATTSPVPSAQVKSAILFAGLAAAGPSIVVESQPTRPNTEEMLGAAGATLERRRVDEGEEIRIEPSALAPRLDVPADPSQAAFCLVAGLLAADGEVSCRGLYGDPTRTGFLDVLARMGARLERGPDDDGAGLGHGPQLVAQRAPPSSSSRSPRSTRCPS